MLVIDASVAAGAAATPDGFQAFSGGPLIAPPLLWSEVTSSLREQVWRGAISLELARLSLDALERAPIERRLPASLYREAWRVAAGLGWAKTYDAEYVALARIEGCRLVTLDARLKRGCGHLVEIIGPTEL